MRSLGHGSFLTSTSGLETGSPGAGPASCGALPVTGMLSSIDMQCFPGYELRAVQVKHRFDDLRDRSHSPQGMKPSSGVLAHSIDDGIISSYSGNQCHRRANACAPVHHLGKDRGLSARCLHEDALAAAQLIRIAMNAARVTGSGKLCSERPREKYNCNRDFVAVDWKDRQTRTTAEVFRYLCGDRIDKLRSCIKL